MDDNWGSPHDLGNPHDLVGVWCGIFLLNLPVFSGMLQPFAERVQAVGSGKPGW